MGEEIVEKVSDYRRSSHIHQESKRLDSRVLKMNPVTDTT